MQIKEVLIPTRRDIEEKIKNVGDYVKIDYLTSYLKMNIDFDTRKFVLNALSKLYESRKMFSEAAKLMRASADINATFDGKVNDFMKSVDLYIKAGVFDEADISFNKAIALAKQIQKNSLRVERKNFYIAYTKEAVKSDKRKHAMEGYEKILELDLNPQEREIAVKELSLLYEKLGKIREFYNLKKTGSQPVQKVERREIRRYEGPSASEIVDSL